jgi:hypothetical protein
MRSLPTVHSVHFYENHDALIERLCGIVSSSLLIGNSVLLVCTEEHRAELIRSLDRLEVDVRDHARQGRFLMYDAGEMLSAFMVGRRPDEERFRGCVGKVLGEAKKAARSRRGGLTVFGEMVAVLWEKGNKAGAVALEKLWNHAMQERAFHLHCAYPTWLFQEDDADLQEIYHAHTHILGDARVATTA